MSKSVWIKNGRVVDPGRGIDRREEVLTLGGRMTLFSPETAEKAEESLDAAGCLVLPGLIDFHAHLARRMTDTGVHADLMALPNGITSVVDAGSAGAATVDAFVQNIIGGSETGIKLFLNVSALGVATERHAENPDPGLYDEEALREACERYPDHILGLKIRLGRGFSDGHGLKSLDRAKEISRRAGNPLCVHLTDPELPYPDYLNRLEKGDILCHCFQGRGKHTILDGSGRISRAARQARERGVIFDVAAGRINCDLEISRRALDDGFPPDIISSDAVATSVYQPKLFHLLYVMSAFLALGMPLAEVIRASTAVPAALMGMGGRLGSLAPEFAADLAIIQPRDRPLEFRDQFGHAVAGNLLLVPMATIKAGRSVYKRIDFVF
jgi:dihydroorotase